MRPSYGPFPTVPFPCFVVYLVDGAEVVQATAGNQAVLRLFKGAGHHPGGPERNRLQLVGGVAVPDDELAVLRGGDEVGVVAAPVHCVDLAEVTSQVPADLEVGAELPDGAVAVHRILEIAVLLAALHVLNLRLQPLHVPPRRGDSLGQV